MPLTYRVGLDGTDGVQLTDATDDFDYVFDDSPQGPRDRFTFQAIDGAKRSDVWVSNYRELGLATDPWDPDTDDDGLTDGWEITDGIPASNPSNYHSFDDNDGGLNATDPDTDGDGYWDGWIGVYGVGQTDNVVLYNEHLSDDDNKDGNFTNDGVQGEEIVQRQVGFHEVAASSLVGANIDQDPALEHSNLHMGNYIGEQIPHP